MGCHARRLCIGGSVLQRLGVDVIQHQLQLRAQAGGIQPTSTAAATDVEQAQTGATFALQMLAQEVRKAVGVGAEEHRVGSVGGKGRMQIALPIKAGDAHAAAKKIALLLQHSGLLRQCDSRLRQQDCIEGQIPAKHVAQRLRHCALAALQNALLRERCGRGEGVAALTQGVQQVHQGRYLQVHGGLCAVPRIRRVGQGSLSGNRGCWCPAGPAAA